MVLSMTQLRQYRSTANVDTDYPTLTLFERFGLLGEAPTVLPEISDRWILSSALQKLIRRGQGDQATAAALRLHQIDQTYLRRRLPVVAVEDVGIGNLGVCDDVVSLCSAAGWWREDVSRTIAFLVLSMACAVKSRAACDALCLAEAHADTPAMMSSLLGAGSEWLVDIAADRSRSQLERMNALRVLGGITIREGNRYRSLSRCNPAALQRVASILSLPPLMHGLMARNTQSDHLAAMLPMVIELSGDAVVKEGRSFPHSLDMISGVSLCALDMHSEVGRGALREFYQSSDLLRGFAARHVRAKSPLRLINMALFHAESSILDRYLSSPGLDALTEDTEREEMRRLGMVDPDHRGELMDIFRAEAGRLAEVRTRRLAALADTSGERAVNWAGPSHE